MPKAFVAIRESPWYRREAFCSGLKAAGYDVQLRGPDRASPGDLFLIWNRYATNHEIASRFEREGGSVVVCENGYLGHGGTSPKFDVHPGGPKPHHYYALAIGGHNGQGAFPVGGPERFAALGVEVQPWRAAGEHILVCPNRAFGIPGRAMHVDWAEQAALRIGKQTARPVRIRRHPGNDKPARPLSADLEGAWAVVIWSSGSGVHALLAGVPVFVEAPFWIMREAGATGTVDEPTCPDRLPHFERMSYAQWTCAEIESGESFRALLK